MKGRWVWVRMSLPLLLGVRQGAACARPAPPGPPQPSSRTPNPPAHLGVLAAVDDVQALAAHKGGHLADRGLARARLAQDRKSVV